jgi:hypothetical protein
MSCSGAHLHNGDKNEQVGHPNNHISKKYIETSYRNKNELIKMSIRAREIHDCWKITEKMMDHIGHTERETECVSSVDGGIQETTDIGPHDKTEIHTCCHGGDVT